MIRIPLWCPDKMLSVLITCPHATCAIPEAHRELFRGSEDLVSSTSGWEPGALNLAQGLAMKFSTPLIHGDVTRLLIDLDQDGEKSWSKISSKLPEATRNKLIDRHRKKFRLAVENRLLEDFKRYDKILHLIIHTAPIAEGKITFEHFAADFAKTVSDAAVKKLPSAEVDSSSIPLTDRNPFIDWLMKTSDSPKYGIIRITVSQSYFLKSLPMRWETIKKSLVTAIVAAAN